MMAVNHKAHKIPFMWPGINIKPGPSPLNSRLYRCPSDIATRPSSLRKNVILVAVRHA